MNSERRRQSGQTEHQGDNTHTLVVWNPKSRSGSQHLELKRTIKATPGVRVIEAASSDEVRKRIEQFSSEGLKRVVAAGGDGTVSAVVSDIVAAGLRNVAFAVLPLGTGNDFARSLGMPLVPEEAWSVCMTGNIRPIDVMKVTAVDKSWTAANMVTGGNTGRYTGIISDDDKKTWGPFCYLGGVINVLSTLEVFDMEYRIDGEDWRKEAVLNFFIANGKTSGGGLVVAPDASLTDGHFDVVVIRDGTAVGLASLAVNYAVSRFLEHELVHHAKARRIEFRSQKPVALSIDGDAIEEHREWQIECMAGQLLAVFAPDQG